MMDQECEFFEFLTDMSFKINSEIKNESRRKFSFPTRSRHKNVKQHSKMLKRGWSYTSRTFYTSCIYITQLNILTVFSYASQTVHIL